MEKGDYEIMNEIISVKIEKIDDVLVTTSNRVAEELGVNHKDLLEKIDRYIEKFTRAESSALVRTVDFTKFYIPSTYTVEGNFKSYRNYLITEKGVAQLIGGYSAAVSKAFDLNVAYINEFERMRNVIIGGKIPSSFKEALQLALEQEEKMEALRLENKELKPKASYYDLILQCSDLVSVTTIAKDYGMSPQKLNNILHNLGVQYNQSGIWYLYAKYQDKGYTQTKTQNYNKPDGTQGAKAHTYWTQQGKIFLYNLLKNNGILPQIEMHKEETQIISN